MIDSKNFIEEKIQKEFKKGFLKENLLFRFPPEPNGDLHIGHVKAISLNIGLNKLYKSYFNLRFDDTNPTKEDNIYVYAIKNYIEWLGFFWYKEFYSSDYFDILYKWAFHFIQNGKAYIEEKIKDFFILPEINSSYRNRSKEENLIFLKKMKYGKFEERTVILRAKIDRNCLNLHLRDPIMYRILKAPHKITKKKWSIYPIYDWAHGQSDFIERISHSLCSLEFKNHRPVYNWFLKNFKKKSIPTQIEFSRLNITYMPLSKSKLYTLIKDGLVKGWNDPRVSTLSGLRKKGYTSKTLLNICHCIGISKRENIIDRSILEFNVREQLNKFVSRMMIILNPVKILIENYPQCKTEWFQTENNPKFKKKGKRKIPFSKILFLEKEDFMEKSSTNFFRLSIGKEVRLKNAYIIKGTGFLKDSFENIFEIKAILFYKINEKKIKSTLHWITMLYSISIEARSYAFFSTLEVPTKKKIYNNHSLKIVHGFGEYFLLEIKVDTILQFYRLGYFNFNKKKIIFYRTVKLKK